MQQNQFLGGGLKSRWAAGSGKMEAISAIKEEDVEPSLVKGVPLSFAKGNMIMPLRAENGYLVAAVADPRGILALRDLSQRLGLQPLPMSAAPGLVIDAINRFYGQMGSRRWATSRVKTSPL
jgi:hypothetical protein